MNEARVTRKSSFGIAFLLTTIAAALAATAASAQGEASADLVASGLSQPLFLSAPSGDARLFVVERAGRIRIVRNGSVNATPFLDIHTQVTTSGEGGLLGLAFAPDYAQSGLFYVYYTDLAGDSVVSRFSVSADPAVADPSETPILFIDQPFSNHNGGTIAFGPDGFLYFGTGDGGSSNDPDERAQNLGVLLGKLLRLDVGPSFAPGSLPVAGEVYRIPADNPFVGVGGARAEIWALGLRNPYRWSFDRATGDLWIADVGQGAREEVDFEPADDPGGRNYGWDVMEGFSCNPNDPAPAPPCNDPSLTLPIYDYGHASGRCSITGGYVYRGALSPLWGLYFFGDYCSGEIWSLDPQSGQVVDRSAELGAAGSSSNSLVGFGEDGHGHLYVVLASGSVYEIRAADPACSDGIDNDGDGLVDLDDPGCQGNPARVRENRSSCGAGPPVAVLLPLLWLRGRRRSRVDA